MWYTCTCTLQPYRDKTYVLFCRLIKECVLLLFLTIFIRYKAEMQDNRHIVDAIYMYLFKFIYRSYRYIFHVHLIPSFSNELWPSGYDDGLINWGHAELMVRILPWTRFFFVKFTYSVFLASGMTAFNWNQAWHSSEVEVHRKRER